MPEPDKQSAAAGSGGLLQSLQDGVTWFRGQSENTRIVLLLAAILVGQIALIALYSFLSDHLVAILMAFAGVGLLSSLGSAIWYLWLRRQDKAEDRRRLEGQSQACPSCAEWNDKEAEFCLNCARPFKDQKMLAEFLAYQERRPSAEREAWSRGKETTKEPSPAPAPPPARPSRGKSLPAGRSFTWAALVTMLLYLFLCWPIGAIANLMWLSEAERMYERTGVSPAGRGCLKILGVVFILVPFVLVVIVVLVLYLQSKGVSVVNPQG
jgi:hypothetical protein